MLSTSTLNVCLYSFSLQYTYENQRWNPVDGFCSALLPTDRAHFSTMDGREARPKESVKCPTMAWQWEGNWTVETNFEGKTLEKDVGATRFYEVLQEMSE